MSREHHLQLVTLGKAALQTISPVSRMAGGTAAEYSSPDAPQAKIKFLSIPQNRFHISEVKEETDFIGEAGPRPDTKQSKGRPITAQLPAHGIHSIDLGVRFSERVMVSPKAHSTICKT